VILLPVILTVPLCPLVVVPASSITSPEFPEVVSPDLIIMSALLAMVVSLVLTEKEVVFCELEFKLTPDGIAVGEVRLLRSVLAPPPPPLPLV